MIAPDLPIGTRITNTGTVTWNNPPQTASASVSIDVGGMVGVGVLNGKAWHDANFNTMLDATSACSKAGRVELYRNDLLLRSATHRRERRLSDQRHRAELRHGRSLRAALPRAGRDASTAKLGRAHSAFTNDLQRISDIVVQFGQQPAGSEPADLAERRRLQHDLAHADRGRHAADAEREHAARRCRLRASTIRRSRTRSRSPTATTAST